MHAGARLDDHLMAVGHQHPDGVRVEGDPAFLKHDFLGDANAQTLVTGGDLRVSSWQRAARQTVGCVPWFPLRCG